jgi:putative ABC transport system permease protein
MQTLLQDLRYGIRMLLKSPGFTVVAVITLCLGIGANSAIFSVLNAVLLRPLAYRDPDRLIILFESNLKKGWDRVASSPANFLDWKHETRTFEELAAGRKRQRSGARRSAVPA